ncbi:putative Microtubule-associated protein TORTIFOLIA1 [Tripterygium wilfordii]|uniref:Putative Microtubule-associated protein TORTIFOLIA1 n=1 Tax=Tripterygium wilfordii TaxID=458696 RepID=A0A7J7C7I2_TRIWF|nr:TORTIFOLIA1-like protein 3 [Tripterygium wilfordii]XP_038688161.1 TORTIFOLIA1-like protein 3 [Tripterygium wilfordii]XP_038688162.1 TORTIFOLIA1-like protein 3 [Tripterygium wilfordii]XP_038688163.1 TORTIFOLIA1-like protein 3 [Tripterygium wilfordii]KAF5730104.1 putative Microtubule-associated protein TORTIFOLIA1 [Tripterygium wilfordii]
MAQNLKLKVFTCLTKLGDRDTYSIATSELDSIVASLDSSTLPTFVSCILSTDTTDKPAIRKHCLLLLADISISHTQSLSPFLPKILAHLTRRLRDSDSSVRSQCISTVSALTANVTRAPFSSAFLRPLSDALFTEQDRNAQIGSALCLAAAIDAAPDPDPGRLGRALMPKLERLLKNEGFRAKSAVLVVVGSVIGAGALSGRGVEGLRSLVQCLLGFLSSEDWAARKAAAEGLERLAIVETDALPEFKAGCLKAFENRKFDKVKAVREVMNQMIEAWKKVPDVSEEASPPPQSQASSREDAIDGRYPPGSKNSIAARSEAHRMRKKTSPASRSTPPASSSATVAGKKNPSNSSLKKTGPAIFQKLDCKKASDCNVGITVPIAASSIEGCDDTHKMKEEQGSGKTRFGVLETRRALFNKSSDENTHKFSASRVAPCHEESPESNVLNRDTENHNNNHKESEDLSLISKQLVQIEKQQSSLLDLLQRFIGSSQTSIHTLETRVHGLELALDEISYDLAVKNGRMTNAGSHGTTCCLLPGAEFLSSKFWRRTEDRQMTSKFSTSNGIPSATMRSRGYKSGTAGTSKLDHHRLQLQGGGGFIVNPLAEIQGATQRF